MVETDLGEAKARYLRALYETHSEPRYLRSAEPKRRLNNTLRGLDTLPLRVVPA